MSFGTNPLWKCRHLDHLAVSFEIPPLAEIPFPPRRVKQNGDDVLALRLRDLKAKVAGLKNMILFFSADETPTVRN